MISNTKPIFSFYAILLLTLSVVFGIHTAILYFLDIPLFENLIVFSYTVNYILAILIFSSLFLLQNKYEQILGFVFMGGSFFKFTVYFIFFNPVFRKNGDVSAIEAASFLIPYIVCLILETIALVKLLNNKI